MNCGIRNSRTESLSASVVIGQEEKYMFFMMIIMTYWNRLPREVVDVLSLETFKIKLDGALSNLI